VFDEDIQLNLSFEILPPEELHNKQLNVDQAGVLRRQQYTRTNCVSVLGMQCLSGKTPKIGNPSFATQYPRRLRTYTTRPPPPFFIKATVNKE
jgi:hypothetical protein